MARCLYTLRTQNLSFNQHPPRHFHVEGMTEPHTIIPMHTRAICDKAHRAGHLRADFHTHPMIDQHETMRQIFHRIQSSSSKKSILIVAGTLGVSVFAILPSGASPLSRCKECAKALRMMV